ncbi:MULTISPECIES: reprolysin-like metallopeptidase [Flavobacterium]|uniref:reprolysin-like metallopeptidase n=1 Tax=Flavobacterium TaxID=237 RepID=UPI001FCC48F1|nr:MULTISPECIES: GEVED domain-containing protein [Flavobacterium]UOK43612.1 M12 family metallo-peptidase [Flavobacterium enshiense]
MKRLICAALLFTVTYYGIAQSKDALWKKSNTKETAGRITQSNLPQKNIFDLDLPTMKKMLAKSPKRDASNITSNTIISLPNGQGKLENFKVYENSVMAPELAAKYPEIKSYVAVGIDNPNARVYLSSSPLGFKSMTIYPNKETVYIEPINNSTNNYTVYRTTDHVEDLEKFDCGVDHSAESNYSSSNTFVARGADDAKLRTYRLAVSCTGEYAAYFGGTKALALAGITNTLTRVNGIFERDFGVRLVLVANNDAILYTNATTDPYSTKAYIPNELQTNLNTTIGDVNYDLGHLFDSVIGGGNSGCIGCIGVTNYKGKAYTSTLYVPEGDQFDVEIAAHELAHQLGAKHTFTYVTENSNTAQMEPGSGSTIMSYAGKTVKDIQAYSDDYFHAISIQQVTDNLKTKTCGTITNTSNAVPVVNAGLDYTIPKGTPFVLTGAATDGNTNDILTYSWEQMDLGSATTTVPTNTATSGAIFRSYPPTTSATRYFPNMNTILTGETSTAGRYITSETLPGVARTLNFRLTVRDNRAGGGSNNTDDVVLTVDGAAGPFTVDTQNTAVSYAAGTSQTINWTVAGTNANGVNCANVDILLSTDGGQTFPIALLTGTPNDGSQSVVIPNMPGTTNRIMVKGSNHIFFDVNNANFTITGSADTAAPTASTLWASGTTASSTNLTWTAANDNVGVTGYDVYQNGVLKTTTTATSLAVTSLSSSTTYNFHVKAKDAAGNVSSASNTANVTTLAPADTTAPTASTLSASGTTASSTNLTWTAATDNVGVTGYNVYQNGVLKTTVTGTSLAVSGLTASTAYNFYVTAKDAAGNVSTTSNIVNVTTSAPTDTTAPTASTLSASGTTASSTNLSWTAASDNVGVTGYNVYQNGVLKTTTTATSLAVSGLSASTAYNFYVTAKDAAGNVSSASNTVSVTTSALTDTAAPTASTLSATGTTTSSTNLSWTVASDNVGVTGYNVYQNGVLKTTVTGTTLAVSGMSASTAYNFYVTAIDAAGNVSTASNTVNVTALGTSITYCNSSASTSREYINRVQLGSINNLSGNNNGYGNYTTQSTSLSTGSTASITITPGWNGMSANEAYCVWIDFNKDGNFGSNELIFSKSKTKSTSVSGNFIIPSTAVTGATRMRVSMKYNGLPTACEVFTNGEVEDYTVTIVSGAFVKNANEINDESVAVTKGELGTLSLKLYPNPVKDGTLYFSGIESNASYKIFNLTGQQVAYGDTNNNSIKVDTLPSGIYIIEISDSRSVGTKRFIKE